MGAAVVGGTQAITVGAMNDAAWWQEVIDRVRPISGPAELDPNPTALLISAALAMAVVMVPALWRLARLAVTLVHELGHAMTGVLMGRTFTGFMLRADMSGHAITRGPSRGAGLVLTTWAGYPAPAVVGAVLIWAGARGWAAPVLSAVLVILLLSWIRVRSLLTAIATLAVTAGAGALWWWGGDELQVHVLTAVGLVLLVGAWRHLGAVWTSRGSGSDPAVLARLTRVPKFLWLVSFALVLLAATAVVVLEGRALLG